MKIKLSRSQWEKIGKTAGWIKKASAYLVNAFPNPAVPVTFKKHTKQNALTEDENRLYEGGYYLEWGVKGKEIDPSSESNTKGDSFIGSSKFRSRDVIRHFRTKTPVKNVNSFKDSDDVMGKIGLEGVILEWIEPLTEYTDDSMAWHDLRSLNNPYRAGNDNTGP